MTGLLSGCNRQAPEEWSLSEATQNLDEDQQALVVKLLEEHAGTQSRPKMVGNPDVETDHLKQGQEVYEFYCQQCHGVTGDGNGPAAAAMRPRPRDYRKGIFKFTSTPYGYKPRRDDLKRTLRNGVPGTSMPAFDRLPEGDIDAVVDYVLALTHRGEFERELTAQASDLEEYQEDIVNDALELIDSDWNKAEASIVYPLTPQPQFTAENVQRGKDAFTQAEPVGVGCMKCHGADGRGLTQEKIGKDIWGHPTKAADITSGMLRGGSEPLDIYRRIHSGINGTPMPNFSNSLKERPELLWDLVAYVMYLSNVRRNGEIPTAAPIPQPGESVIEAEWNTNSKKSASDDSTTESDEA
ncbi:MAG: c-type cytochrome [Planctomycetaceae bacterium]|nr:c-type cytochrome [Planctomycetaceae bacterium]